MAVLIEDRAFFRCARCDLTRGRVRRRRTGVDEPLYVRREISDKVVVVVQYVLLRRKGLFIIYDINEGVVMCTELRIQRIQLTCHSLSKLQRRGFVRVILQTFEWIRLDE